MMGTPTLSGDDIVKDLADSQKLPFGEAETTASPMSHTVNIKGFSPVDASEAQTETDGIQKIVTSLPVDHTGTIVYLKGWVKESSAKHPIIIVHDLGEHLELYRKTALAFVEQGYSVYAFDLRGHGRSGRRLGHAPSFNVLVKDLLQVAAWVRHIEDGYAPIILGHGIGALITLDFTKQYGNYCYAAILSAPCLELATQVTWATRFAIKFLADVAPTFRIPAGLSPRFAKDLKIVQEDQDDHTKISYFPRLTAVFAHELLGAMMRVEASFIEYHGSVLILCPTADTICNYGTLKKSAALHNEHNLKIQDLDGVGHNVFTESDSSRQGAIKVILSWLDEVLVTSNRPSASVHVSEVGSVSSEAINAVEAGEG